MSDPVNRRNFIKSAAAVGATFGAAKNVFGKASRAPGRVIGANDTINVGVIGVGGRGNYLASAFTRFGETSGACKVVAVSDVYEKRKRAAAERYKADGYLDYREIINRNDIDGVLIATPDHWHAKIALEAMDKGKDVYLEKPMCHTLDETRRNWSRPSGKPSGSCRSARRPPPATSGTKAKKCHRRTAPSAR
jgi:hypothetical protein